MKGLGKNVRRKSNLHAPTLLHTQMNWLSGEKPMGNFLDAARERLPVVSGTSSHSPPSQMLTAGLTLFMPSYDEANLRQEVSDVAEKAGFEVLKIDIKEWRQLIRGY